MIIILFTLLDEMGPLYDVAPNQYQNPYRNLIDLYYQGVEYTLATMNAAMGSPYAQMQDPDWPDPTSSALNSVINPDFVAPYDVAQTSEQFITNNYFPSFDSTVESLLLDANAVTGFNIALNFDNTAIVNVLCPPNITSPPYPSIPSGTFAATYSQFDLHDIDLNPAKGLFGINPNNLGPASIPQIIPATATPQPLAIYIHQLINTYISANWMPTPAAGQTPGTTLGGNSYKIFTQAFNTSANYPVPGGVTTMTPTGTPIYTAWLNFIYSINIGATYGSIKYTENHRASALIALAIMQGAYNYWCQVYWDCYNNPATPNLLATQPTIPPTNVSNGYLYMYDWLGEYNGAAGTTHPLSILLTLDWRQMIQQSIKGALSVLANSQVNGELNLGDQGFLMGAAAASISAGVRNFGTQVVVGISSLDMGMDKKTKKIDKKTKKLGTPKSIVPTDQWVVQQLKSYKPKQVTRIRRRRWSGN